MRLIEHWPTVLWRSATTRTTALLTFLVGAFAQTHMVVFAFLAFMPWPVQIVVGGFLVLIVVGGPIILSRLTVQPKMNDKIEAKRQTKRQAEALARMQT